MSGNTIGKLFTVTTFGESHGPALGCIVDGCPPGMALSESDLQADVDRQLRPAVHPSELDQRIRCLPNRHRFVHGRQELLVPGARSNSKKAWISYAYVDYLWIDPWRLVDNVSRPRA